MSKLHELSATITRPNQGSVTRWGGMIEIYIWIGKHWDTLEKRYVEPEDCVENDDGTRCACLLIRNVKHSPHANLFSKIPVLLGIDIIFLRTSKHYAHTSLRPFSPL